MSMAPKQMGKPNYCNPARGASEIWMMTMFRSAGREHGRIRRSSARILTGLGTGEARKGNQGEMMLMKQ